VTQYYRRIHLVKELPITQADEDKYKQAVEKARNNRKWKKGVELFDNPDASCSSKSSLYYCFGCDALVNSGISKHCNENHDTIAFGELQPLALMIYSPFV